MYHCRQTSNSCQTQSNKASAGQIISINHWIIVKPFRCVVHTSCTAIESTDHFSDQIKHHVINFPLIFPTSAFSNRFYPIAQYLLAQFCSVNICLCEIIHFHSDAKLLALRLHPLKPFVRFTFPWVFVNMKHFIRLPLWIPFFVKYWMYQKSEIIEVL